MARRQAVGPAGELRRSGVRLSAGPWTICARAAPAGRGRVIVALGRTAGQAVTRSRIRRLARDVLAGTGGAFAALDLLLLARSALGDQPRSKVRTSLSALLHRVPAALARHGMAGGRRG